MSPEEFQFFLLSQQRDFQTAFSHGLGAQGLQLTPSELPSGPSASAPPDNEQRTGRHGPRGGKKPLRAWQQQLSTLQAEYVQKELDFKRALDEGEKLRQRIKVLEAVLPMREQLSALLRQRRQGPLAQPPNQSGPTLRVLEELQSASSSGPSTSDSDIAQAAEHYRRFESSPPDGLAAKRAAAPPRCAQAPRDALVPWSGAAAAAILSAAVPPDGVVPFSSVVPSNRAPPHVIKNLCSFWNTWVREAALTLHYHDARPNDMHAQQQLDVLWGQLAATFGPLRTEYHLFLTDIVNTNIRTGEREEPPPSFWVPVAQAMRCSPDQVSSCKAALDLYQERRDKLMEERRELLEHLAAVLATRQQQALMRPMACGNGAGPAGQLVEDLTARLYRNVAMEGHAVEMVKDFMGTSLFARVQLTRSIVLSYPYLPDGVAILNTIVATYTHEAAVAGARAAT